MDFGRKKLRLGDVLINSGTIIPEQLEDALNAQKGTGKKLGQVLVEKGYVSEDDIATALSSQLGLEVVDLMNISIADEILNLVPPSVLKKSKVFPFEFAENNMNVLRVAMVDPMDMYAQDDVSIITNCMIEPAVTTERTLMMAIDKYFGQSEMSGALEAYAKEKKLGGDDEEVTSADEVNSSPIVVMVKEMIDNAVRQRASDIHIEALERKMRVRYRIDGALYERGKYDISLLPAVVARIKIIGGMDIAEKRKPQDGRITQIVDRMEFDIRVSVLPTVYGEKTVMRLTKKKGLTREKKYLGLYPDDEARLDGIMNNPHGIILVTGPTGSGKSTTCYTVLNELNKPEVNIITVEDPVEANVAGINQVQVNVKAGLTFASALRSILRQDPDIIMIGEIRDGETAQIAVQASITGHLVISTLHTNSTSASVTRLIDMGVEAYMIGDAVVGIIAQRLVRRLCPECKVPHEATEREKIMLGYPVEQPLTIYEPGGCEKCGTGYKGRKAIYEIMPISAKIRRIRQETVTAEMIQDAAVSEGMNTLRMAGARNVVEGVTSIAEMVRVAYDMDAANEANAAGMEEEASAEE